MSDIFNLTVPEEELDKRPDGGPMPAGAYKSTLQTGAELVNNDTGWKGLRIPFAGFASTKNGAVTFDREIRAQFTFEHATSTQAVEIGQRNIIGAARAFGLTEEVGGGHKLTASSYEELISQLDAVAGTEVEVYVKAKASNRLKDDGTPFINNEIARVSALEG